MTSINVYELCFQSSFFTYIYSVLLIQAATSGVYKAVGDKARSRPGQIVTDMNIVIEKLLTGHYAFPHVSTFL